MLTAKSGLRFLVSCSLFLCSGLVKAGWVQTTDGSTPISCGSGSVATGAWCTGSNCDNVWLYCEYIGGLWSSHYPTAFFSEEGQYWKTCNEGYALTGLTCTGNYCDNISLECSYTGSLLTNDCRWTQWFSEEQGGLFFDSGWYARGAACRGNNCDDMMYYICQRS